MRLPADRLLYQQLQQLAGLEGVAWREHRYVRTIQGHKQTRVVALAGAGELTEWDSYRAAAAGYGQPDATLWACLVRERAPTEWPLAEAEALVSTRAWAQPWAAFQAYRGRWAIEDATFRELKEGWGLERQPWGARHETICGRVALTLLAFNTAQLYRTQGGQQLADKGIRRLRQLHRRELGAAPVVVYLAGRYGVFAVEEVFALLGAPVRASLLPRPPTGGRQKRRDAAPPDPPTRSLDVLSPIIWRAGASGPGAGPGRRRGGADGGGGRRQVLPDPPSTAGHE